MTTESARGLFAKYAKESRTATKLVVWLNFGSDGAVREIERWERKKNAGEMKDEEKPKETGKTPVKTQPVASGALVDVGLYVVAHGNDDSQVAGAGVYSLVKKLSGQKIPRASKVSFVACYSGRRDKAAIDDARFRDYDPVEHGLEAEELSFVSMFAVGYQNEYKGDDRPLHVAGWDSFVSVYHPNKLVDVPLGASPEDVGRKYVANNVNGYTFMKPKSTSRKDKKRMFKWSFVDGQAKVERVDLDNYKRSL